MQPYENFYKNGYEEFDFNPLGLNDVMRDIMKGELKSGFTLDKKYEKTADLRPNVIDYHKDFLEVLKANQVNSFLRSRTLRNLTLFHIQVRVSESTTSYMDWHRDTYFDNDKKFGMTPPGAKIIYYPHFDEDESNQTRLRVCERSHRTMIDNVRNDMSIINMFPVRDVKSSNSKAIFFDTSILHAVVPDKPGKRSIRLIYSFLPIEQFEKTDKLHFRTSESYEALF